MSARYRSGHLGDAVDHYVDGTLDADSSRRAARHLLVCSQCRREVDAERAIVAEVRAVHVDPERHACLVAGLLALSPQEQAVAPNESLRRPRRGRGVIVASAMTLGSAAAVLAVTGTAHHAHPIAPPVAHQRNAPGRAMTDARPVSVLSGTGQATGVMTANQAPSGRIDP